jgi:hypothetical protein
VHLITSTDKLLKYFRYNTVAHRGYCSIFKSGNKAVFGEGCGVVEARSEDVASQ